MTTAAFFDRGALHYDLMVGLNPGYHRELRRAAEALTDKVHKEVPENVTEAPRERSTMPEGLELLDLACGSGASTEALAMALGMGGAGQHPTRSRTRIRGVDASAGMLAQARAKSWPAGVDFVHGVVGHLDPGHLGVGKDGILACYLFRNIPDEVRDHAVAEVFGLLRPGGWLVVQEYSVPSRRARWIWTVVSWAVIIPLGVLIDRDHRLHAYLWRSVLGFDTVSRFAERLVGAGFTELTHRTAAGWQRGILHTIVARRPEES